MKRGRGRAAASGAIGTKGDSQLDLFDASAVPQPPRADDFERWAELRGRLSPRIRLGTSSWTFPGWAGIVYRRTYPSKAAFTHESLLEYAAHPLFRTVSLDRGYYAPVAEEELAAYAAQTPSDFRFVAKVWSEIATRRFPKHPRLGARSGQANPAFLDAAIFEAQVAGPLRRGLGDKLGAVLLEIPPAPGTADNDEFLGALSDFLRAVGGSVPLAVEIRDPRLLNDDYFTLLRTHGAAHTFNYWSRMPPIAEQRRLAGEYGATFVVARLMLPPGRKYEVLKEEWSPFDRIVEPQPAMRIQAIDLTAHAAGAGKDVYVVVNNKAEGSSPLTVAALAEGLASPVAVE